MLRFMQPLGGGGRIYCLPKFCSWDFPGCLVIKTLLLPMQGTPVPSLVGELSSHVWPKKKKHTKTCSTESPEQSLTFFGIQSSVSGLIELSWDRSLNISGAQSATPCLFILPIASTRLFAVNETVESSSSSHHLLLLILAVT